MRSKDETTKVTKMEDEEVTSNKKWSHLTKSPLFLEDFTLEVNPNDLSVDTLGKCMMPPITNFYHLDSRPIKAF